LTIALAELVVLDEEVRVLDVIDEEVDGRVVVVVNSDADDWRFEFASVSLILFPQKRRIFWTETGIFPLQTRHPAYDLALFQECLQRGMREKQVSH
jgi:hypothetical protein